MKDVCSNIEPAVAGKEGRMNRSILLSLLLVIQASAVQAQASPPLSKGARVRVTFLVGQSSSPQQVVGTLQRLDGDTVVIAHDSGTMQAVSLSGGEPLQLSLGRRGHEGTGALIGAVVGLLLIRSTWQQCGDCGPGIPVYGVLAGLAGGTVVGAIVGNEIRSEAWVPVQTAGIRIVVGPGRAGFVVPL
jgi:hypothetical protein